MTPTARRTARTRRRLLVVALLGLVGALLPGRPAAAGASALSSVTVANAAGGSVQVSWTADGDPHRWKVVVISDGRLLGQRTFPGSVRSGRIGHVPPGTAVAVAVGGIDEAGAYRSWHASSTIRAPRDPRCPVTSGGTCVHIDAAKKEAPVTGVGLGILHGVTASTSATRLDGLDVRHWRISAFDEERFRLARDAGGSITALLSDPWIWHMGMGDGRVHSPWAHLDFYHWWVTAIVQWHVDEGLVPDQWEVQNEPMPSAFDAANPPTRDAIVEQHLVATEAIRSVLPDAKVVGPSFYPFENGAGLVDFGAFAAKAAARGLELDAVAWHEITGACRGCDGGPNTVRQHVDDARSAMAAAGLGTLPIDITEYGATYEQLQPGAIVGYLDALADSGVRFGGMSCWDRDGTYRTGCFVPEGTLDGLVLPSGAPTDAWWTYKAYAALSATGHLTRTTVDDPATSAVASTTATNVKTLVGRHGGCTAADAPCPDGTAPGAVEKVALRMTFPTSGRWDVVVTRIASNTGASGGPKKLAGKSVTVTSTTGAVSLGTYALAEGEVLYTVAKRR